MSKKILFVDLDGTLMRDDKTISEENHRAIKEMTNAGNYIAIATGRAISSARNIAKTLGLTFSGCYLVAYNGATIYDCAADCILQSKKLPIEYAEYLYNEAKAAGIYIQTYSDRQILAEKRTKELAFYVERTKMPYRIEPDVWSMLNQEPPKMLLIDLENKKKLEKFQKDHMEWEKGKCVSFFSCPEYLEYCPLGATKGYGVEYLEKFLGIPHENTIAVGDQENDITMIQNAAIGVAMKNGDKKAKDAADYITEHDNNHDGVAEVIRRFIL